MTWHIPHSVLDDYRSGRLHDSDAWSVEAHLTSCEYCRDALAVAIAEDPVAASALSGGWAELEERLPSKQGNPRAGSVWRELVVLAAAGPAARLAWLASCTVVLVIAAVLGMNDITTLPWVGMVAPVLPVLGVAASYGSGLDDTYEVITSTPGGGFRLLLIRSAVVLAVTTPLALVAGVVTGKGSPVPWLLASLSLTLATLALGSVIGVARAAVASGLVWLIVIGNWSDPNPGKRPGGMGEAITRDVDIFVLTPDAIPIWLAVAAVAAFVVIVRRQAYDHLPRIRIEAFKS